MKKLLLLITLLALTTNYNKAFASHIPGANITYTCDPANPLTYTFTLTLFRICPGTHPATMTSTYFTLTNTCGLTNPVVPTFNQVGVAEDVNQLCATATSDCSGGTSPGVWKYTYEATITLPADCDSWTIAFDLCCRDASTNMSGGTANNMATSTTMNTQTAPCNDSPVVSSIPMPYACAGSLFTHCLSVYDAEGDSITYSMVPPAGAGQAPIANLAPWTSTAPLTGFVLDPLTGCYSFTEPLVGDYVVAIAINSYDNAGNLIGTVIHDFKIIVMSCTNTPPSNPVSGITNFTGTGTQTGPNTITACYGDNVCFDVVFQDVVNPGDAITITQDGTTVMPGATFVQTGTNPATGTFCWTVQPGYTGSIVTFVAGDDGCPVMGTSGFAVDFDIQTGVYAGPDPYICGAQTTSLLAQGAGTYTWSPATGLSCTNCPNPTASPASTTTYTVTGNLTGTCPNVDQVTVNVVPDFPLAIVPPSATICANEVVQITAGGPAGSTYDWTPTAYLNDPTIADPLASPLTTTTYTATVTSPAGCTKSQDVTITVSGVGPTVEISPSDTTVCPGESINVTTTANVYPALCGLSSGCTGTTSTADVGIGTTATSTYDVFYGSTVNTTNYTNKVQYIYTAAELNALGYYGGTIRDIAFNMTTSTSYTYDNVEIWMGCTSLDEFPGANFEGIGAMTQVYGPVNNLNLTNANWHTFNISDYDWDGVSNIIIQFCGEENNAGTSGSESMQYTSTTPYYRCLYDHSTITTAPSCDEATGTRVTNRPNMRFNICEATISSPTYSWSPATDLSSSTVGNPTVTPSFSSGTTSYVLSVTANGCTGSGIMDVTVDNPNTISTAPDTLICPGDSYDLNGAFGGPLPSTSVACGLGSACTGPTTTASVGTTTTTSSTYGPFYGSYYDVKYQFLYHASDLIAAGFTSGTITEISFDVATKSSTGAFNGFTIRMGCTNTTSLAASNGWEPTQGPVWGPTNYTSVAGWNTFTLTTPFNWDGVSNIVVECCFDNTVAVGSDIFRYSATTGLNTTMRYYSNTISPGCALSATYQYAYRPNMQFTICDPPPIPVVYTWTPPLDLSDPTVLNPTATPSTPGTTVSYALEVTGGICPVYDTVTIVVCDPLPIELYEFDGENNGPVNQLYWTTSSEVNNDYFMVQRSANGTYFEDFSRVEGAGNSNSPIDYFTTDDSPLDGINYYRLKQVDFDGNYGYSDVIALNTNSFNGVQIYPNPSTGDLFVNFEETSGTFNIVVRDITGKKFIEKSRNAQQNETFQIHEFSDLVSGVYLVQVLNLSNETIKIQKIVKQ